MSCHLISSLLYLFYLLLIPVIDGSVDLHLAHQASPTRAASAIRFHANRAFPFLKRTAQLRIPRIFLHYHNNNNNYKDERKNLLLNYYYYYYYY